MGRGKSRDRHAWRRAGDIVEPCFMTEGDGFRVSTVLTADAHIEIGLELAPPLDSQLHELAYPLDVEPRKDCP